MSYSEIISVALSVITVFTAIASVIIANKTLNQNSKMIENSTRPYLVIYGEVVHFQNMGYILILKNCGASAADVSSITFSESISPYLYKDDRLPFMNVAGTSFAPGQSMHCHLVYPNGIEVPPINIDICYSASEKNYADSFVIDPKSEFSNLIVRASTDNKELKIISYTLQDIAEKLL